jgi:hypothetical protein
MTTNPLEATTAIRPFDALEQEYLSRPEYQLRAAVRQALDLAMPAGYWESARVINQIIKLAAEIGPNAYQTSMENAPPQD